MCYFRKHLHQFDTNYKRWQPWLKTNAKLTIWEILPESCDTDIIINQTNPSNRELSSQILRSRSTKQKCEFWQHVCYKIDTDFVFWICSASLCSCVELSGPHWVSLFSDTLQINRWADKSQLQAQGPWLWFFFNYKVEFPERSTVDWLYPPHQTASRNLKSSTV